jgi:hypothetical protein
MITCGSGCYYCSFRVEHYKTWKPYEFGEYMELKQIYLGFLFERNNEIFPKHPTKLSKPYRIF